MTVELYGSWRKIKHGDNHRGKRGEGVDEPRQHRRDVGLTVSEEGERDAVQQRREDE